MDDSSPPVRSPQRSNPFDREILMDEHHFEPTLVEAFANSTDETSVPDWELGLSPPSGGNAFDKGPGRMGLSRMEELSLAIDSCKEMILSSTEHSEKRRKLVAKLVQLRLQVQEIKDGPVEITEADRNICSHRFMLQERTGRNPYCERCMGIVWRLVQPWYRCKVCGYRSHAKCLNLVTRKCAGVLVRQKPHYILKICPEKGLASQKYRCAECKTKIAFGKNKEREPRLCDYNGLFYCSSCHWNDELVIPGRVLHNWDFTKYKVSRSTKQLLELLFRKPLLNVEKLNPALFNYIEELRRVRKMRSDILLMKCYFVCCKQARNLRILWHLKRHQHFVEGAELYSLQDLIELKDGRLEAELRSILLIFIQHIKVDCVVCLGKGFTCEFCSDKEIIFPFDDYVSACHECCAVFHRRCYDKNGNSCPRCQRRQVRRESTLATELEPDSSPERPFKKKSNSPTSSAPFVDHSSVHTKVEREVTLEDVLAKKLSPSLRNDSNPFEDQTNYDDRLNPFHEYDEKLNPFAQ